MDPEQGRVAELRKLLETTNVLKKVVDLTQASTTVIPSDSKEGDLRAIFVEAAKHVHNTVTKFYLGTGEASTGPQVKDFVELMDKSITNLIYAGYALMVHPTTVIHLKKYLSAVMANTLDAIAQLTTAIIKKEKQNNNLPTLTGLVWHYCTAIEEGKISNISFTAEAIKKNSTTMQDAISELKEILEAADEAKNNNNDEDDDSDASDDGFDDFFGGDEKLSEQERALVKELVRLTNLCHGFAGNIARVLDISVDLLESSSGPWLEELATQVNELTAHVDEVIMAAQPPIAKSGMQKAVDELIAGVNKVVETIRTSPLTSPVSGDDIGGKSKKLVEVSTTMSSGLHKAINEVLKELKDEDDE